MEKLFSSSISDSPLSISEFLINLAFGALLSLLLRWHFKRFGSTLSNRAQFNLVFPFVILTTILVITVVKSSLALSLGLVGALSIVRFRTPIKEPEELAYLYIAIAFGLGLGAGQTIATMVAAIVILGAMAVIGAFKQKENEKHVFLSLDWKIENNQETFNLDQLHTMVGTHTVRRDLRRFDDRGGIIEVTYLIDLHSGVELSALTADLKRCYPGIGITFLDQNRMPGV